MKHIWHCIRRENKGWLLGGTSKTNCLGVVLLPLCTVTFVGWQAYQKCLRGPQGTTQLGLGALRELSAWTFACVSKRLNATFKSMI